MNMQRCQKFILYLSRDGMALVMPFSNTYLGRKETLKCLMKKEKFYRNNSIITINIKELSVYI